MPSSVRRRHDTATTHPSSSPLMVGKSLPRTMAGPHPSTAGAQWRKAASALVHDRLGDNRDARDTLNARKRGQEKQRREASHRYNPCHDGHYNSGGDRSRSPPPSGPWVFSWHILSVPVPAWYRLPANIQKYTGEMNPDLWLEDYRLACQVSGADGTHSLSATSPCTLSTWHIRG
jgi:hypothetical protein